MFTLRSLAERSSLSLTVLVEGRPGAMDEPVAWVHNTELPDPSPYVREGELTSGSRRWSAWCAGATRWPRPSPGEPAPAGC
ncbi:hypothetical protein FE391_12260 [Nonomuraea sp. KC401]|uniref:hypothetical protein n=1 Tax=unclassified Nonomuraea TaxID=2593643 RepID=UPI0010FDD2C3|nr:MULTISPECIES: hypothetical protein [unclassified Nonomuraea]NBE95928.1 hypothetical protein [Nonomuraea sp. K271]TLF76271.1 hypothetical protein FE391_12260 [Nonomuraea sp. KC401]